MTVLAASYSPAPATSQEIDTFLAYVDQTERKAIENYLRSTPIDEATERAYMDALEELRTKLDATRQHLQSRRVLARMRALL